MTEVRYVDRFGIQEYYRFERDSKSYNEFRIYF